MHPDGRPLQRKETPRSRKAGRSGAYGVANDGIGEAERHDGEVAAGALREQELRRNSQPLTLYAVRPSLLRLGCGHCLWPPVARASRPCWRCSNKDVAHMAETAMPPVTGHKQWPHPTSSRFTRPLFTLSPPPATITPLANFRLGVLPL